MIQIKIDLSDLYPIRYIIPSIITLHLIIIKFKIQKEIKTAQASHVVSSFLSAVTKINKSASIPVS